MIHKKLTEVPQIYIVQNLVNLFVVGCLTSNDDICFKDLLTTKLEYNRTDL